MVWTCHEERPGICRKNSDGNGVTAKEESGKSKRKFLDVVKEDMRELSARKKEIENKRLWRNMIRCENF